MSKTIIQKVPVEIDQELLVQAKKIVIKDSKHTGPYTSGSMIVTIALKEFIAKASKKEENNVK